MKNFNFVVCSLFFFMMALGTQAADTANYFTGQWNVVVLGTPNGDSKMVVSLAQKEGKLEGSVNMGQGDPIKFTQIEEKEASVKLYFNAGGYDIYLFLEKKDDTHVAGTMLDMFDAKGERIAENK